MPKPALYVSPRGHGETAWDEHVICTDNLLLGDSILGQRALDLLQARRALRTLAEVGEAPVGLLAIGAGTALAAKKDGKDFKSYVILGDGELYEGSIWETALFAAHFELDNLTVIVDRNGLCILDDTEHCIKLNPIEDKWRSFGWDAVSVDGHSYQDIFRGFDEISKRKSKKPVAIIANTVKGKGISFMENEVRWHNKMPNAEQAAQARAELEKNCIVS